MKGQMRVPAPPPVEPASMRKTGKARKRPESQASGCAGRIAALLVVLGAILACLLLCVVVALPALFSAGQGKGQSKSAAESRRRCRLPRTWRHPRN